MKIIIEHTADYFDELAAKELCESIKYLQVKNMQLNVDVEVELRKQELNVKEDK